MGYRNLLLTQVGYVRGGVQYPRPGVPEPAMPPDGYRPRDVVLIEAITQYPSPVLGQPPPPRLPGQPLRCRLMVPATRSSRVATDVHTWDAVTNGYGSALLAVYVSPAYPAGTVQQPATWGLEAHLHEPLPNGTGDGDRVAFPVVA